MKRKVAKAVGLRLSPNEEAQLLKEEHERRRKLRLQQVCLHCWEWPSFRPGVPKLGSPDYRSHHV